jgi:hypothetical protein
MLSFNEAKALFKKTNTWRRSMEQVLVLVLIAVITTLVLSKLFSYFFVEAGEADRLWWKRWQEKLARARRLFYRRR